MCRPLSITQVHGHCSDGKVIGANITGIVNSSQDLQKASSALLCPGSAKALSTVTAIIDGMGSCGAALGPLLTGHLAALPGGFDNVFYMLYAASAAAAALLARLVVREVGLQRT